MVYFYRGLTAYHLASEFPCFSFGSVVREIPTVLKSIVKMVDKMIGCKHGGGEVNTRRM